MCYKCNQDCNDSCNETPSPCYDDCGCPVELTFDCVKYTGDPLEYIELEDGKDGNSVIKAIDGVIGNLTEKSGKVAVDASDVHPDYLFDKLDQGTNISLQLVGTGADRRVRITSSTGGVHPDIKAKVSLQDTTSDYLSAKFTNGGFIKKSIVNATQNEQIKFDLIPSELISGDAGNQLTIGVDNRLKTAYTAPDGSETILREGVGVNVSGTGTVNDPYIVSTNPSIQVARPCFDGQWKTLSPLTSNNTNITFLSTDVKFRYRFDGSIEFKGNSTLRVVFGNYSSGNRKFTLPFASLPVSCLSMVEQNGTQDLKGINYIDTPQASSDQIVQQYGYIIRKSAYNIIIELQSSFTNSTTKTVVLSFDGAVSHPNI